MDLTKGQEIARKLIKKWYKNKISQVFYMAGYAGTGKTTAVKEFINDLITEGLITIDEIRFVTFTGKAALELTKHSGFHATTIHSLIYKPDYVEEPVKIKEKVNGRYRYVEKKDENGNVVTEKKFVWKLKSKDELTCNGNFPIKLIVVDEGSMVGQQMGDDLLSYGIPMIIIGDPAQLPPIGQKMMKFIVSEDNMDICLTEIVRQQEGNDIIQLAHKIRNSQTIYMEDYKDSKNVKFMDYDDFIKDERYIRATWNSNNALLVYSNKERVEFNKLARDVLGFGRSKYPLRGDRLICKKNNRKYFLQDTDNDIRIDLVNGLTGYCRNSVDLCDIKKGYFTLEFHPDYFGKQDRYLRVDCDKEIMDLDLSDNDRKRIMGIGGSRYNLFEYSYALTVHVSQGSTYNNIMVINSENVRDYDKWLYTAVTRAKKKLIVVY